VRGRSCDLRQHAGRSRIRRLGLLVLLVLVSLHHLVVRSSSTSVRAQGPEVVSHIARGTWSIWCCWDSGSVWVAAIRVLHDLVAELVQVGGDKIESQ